MERRDPGGSRLRDMSQLALSGMEDPESASVVGPNEEQRIAAFGNAG